MRLWVIREDTGECLCCMSSDVLPPVDSHIEYQATDYKVEGHKFILTADAMISRTTGYATVPYDVPIGFPCVRVLVSELP